MFTHISVMPKEAVGFLGCSPGKTMVDCTTGRGGHSSLMLEKGCRVICIDRDEDALKEAGENLKQYNAAAFVHDNFANIKGILASLNVKAVDGILADLGVSTYQLENEERGFGFNGKLDMRMDKRQELTAADILNKWQEYDISKLLFDCGERKFARSIARAVVRFRQQKTIETGEELLDIIKQTMPTKYRFSREHHWATPAFRALRMKVNNDLENLEKFMPAAVECLAKGGRLVIISFHTMEDRIVKHAFRALAEKGIVKLVVKKPLEASEDEVKANPKAVRAKMRVLEKL